MADIYIKDAFGKLILSERIKDTIYVKTIIVANPCTYTLTIVLKETGQTTSSDTIQWPEKEIIIFNKIAELISNHLSQNFSIEELAENAAMNRTKLQAGFKYLFNQTINSFTQDLRMEKAKELLNSNRGLSLKEIAGMLGYRHSNHFSAAFKKRFNCSPSTFRKLSK